MANNLVRLGKSVAPTLIIFSLWACGTGVDNPNKQVELEDRAVLQNYLEEISGTYAGLIENRADGSDAFPIELSLFVVEEEEGINEEGEVRFRPSLRARYRRTDLFSEGLGERNLKVRYYREKLELAGATSSSPASGGDLDAKFLSFTGLVTGDGALDLVFHDHRGILGYALLTRQE